MNFANTFIDVHKGRIVPCEHLFVIYIANPHEDQHNICRNVGSAGLERFQTLCKLSAKALEDGDFVKQRPHSHTEESGPWGLQGLLPLDGAKLETVNDPSYDIGTLFHKD